MHGNTAMPLPEAMKRCATAHASGSALWQMAVASHTCHVPLYQTLGCVSGARASVLGRGQQQRRMILSRPIGIYQERNVVSLGFVGSTIRDADLKGLS